MKRFLVKAFTEILIVCISERHQAEIGLNLDVHSLLVNSIIVYIDMITAPNMLVMNSEKMTYLEGKNLSRGVF